MRDLRVEIQTISRTQHDRPVPSPIFQRPGKHVKKLFTSMIVENELILRPWLYFHQEWLHLPVRHGVDEQAIPVPNLGR
jgi:hypothetical protein